jgi:hypothetical protein
VHPLKSGAFHGVLLRQVDERVARMATKKRSKPAMNAAIGSGRPDRPPPAGMSMTVILCQVCSSHSLILPTTSDKQASLECLRLCATPRLTAICSFTRSQFSYLKPRASPGLTPSIATTATAARSSGMSLRVVRMTFTSSRAAALGPTRSTADSGIRARDAGFSKAFLPGKCPSLIA